MKRQIVVGLALFAVPACVVTAGDLTPPPGSPSPTMLPLDHVEPSTPITRGEVPITITTPGAYHLVEHLQAGPGDAGMDCITIDVPGVSIDLRGFQITGDITNRWDDAITLTSNAEQCTIRNGLLTESMANGINAGTVEGVTIDRIQAVANRQSGIQLGNSATVTDTRCESNSVRGLSVGAGSTLTRVTSRNNLSTGIIAGASSVVTHCVSEGNQTGIIATNGSTLADCTATQNTSHGFSLTGAVVSRCAATSNTLDGFNTTDSLLTECIARTNAQNGFGLLRSVARGCLSSGNTIEGMHANDSTLRNNSSFANGGSGILVEIGASSLIDGNHCADNGASAIRSFVPSAWIVRNVAGFEDSFLFFVGQADGDATDDPETAGPWANFRNNP